MKDVRGEKRYSAVKVIITTTMIIISPSGAEAASASRWHNDELRSRLSGSHFSIFPIYNVCYGRIKGLPHPPLPPPPAHTSFLTFLPL